MRHGTVRAAALDLELEDVVGRHHRARAHRDGADRLARPVVHAEDGIDRELIEEALLDHDAAAALVLLGGLEDDMHGAGEAARLGEIARGPQQHGGVAVMAAGVHAARVLGAVREAVLLHDVERVHVGPQADRAARPLAALDGADHTGSGQAAMDLDAEGGELLCDELGGRVLLEGGLGVGMEVVAPSGHVRMELCDAIEDGHGSSGACGGNGRRKV